MEVSWCRVWHTFHAHPNHAARMYAHNLAGCPGVGSITVGGHNDFYSPTRPPRNPGWHRGPRPCCACGGRGGGRNLAAATWAPSACFPHPLFPTGPGSGSSFCESPRRGGRGVWRSYFRAIREGGRRGRGVEVEAAQKAQCLLLFHPTEGSFLSSLPPAAAGPGRRPRLLSEVSRLAAVEGSLGRTA